METITELKTQADKSLPSRECGLKYVVKLAAGAGFKVTPLAGVWIEILSEAETMEDLFGHSPRGSVD